MSLSPFALIIAAAAAMVNPIAPVTANNVSKPNSFTLASGTTAPDKIVLRDTVWICNDAGCSASRVDSKPEFICGTVARKLGRVNSMTVRGVALTEAQLEKCNIKAK